MLLQSSDTDSTDLVEVKYRPTGAELWHARRFGACDAETAAGARPYWLGRALPFPVADHPARSIGVARRWRHHMLACASASDVSFAAKADIHRRHRLDRFLARNSRPGRIDPAPLMRFVSLQRHRPRCAIQGNQPGTIPLRRLLISRALSVSPRHGRDHAPLRFFACGTRELHAAQSRSGPA